MLTTSHVSVSSIKYCADVHVSVSVPVSVHVCVDVGVRFNVSLYLQFCRCGGDILLPALPALLLIVIVIILLSHNLFKSDN